MQRAFKKKKKIWDVIVVGGGCAGLSAAIYLARAMRSVLVIDERKSLARWEPRVENYFGFPQSIAGKELLERGRRQAVAFGTRIARGRVERCRRKQNHFLISSTRGDYGCRKVLLATGLWHIPPDIPSFSKCIGRGIYFCKDCDGYRVRGKSIAVVGVSNDAAEFALGVTCYTKRITILTNGAKPEWDRKHAKWLSEYDIPVKTAEIVRVGRKRDCLNGVVFADGQDFELDALFTIKGDIVHNQLARIFRAKTDGEGFIKVDACMRTSVKGLFAAGCVTPANCQMIIAAGNGATAAQTINRELFEESLKDHALCRTRKC